MSALFKEDYQVKILIILIKNRIPGLRFFLKEEYFFIQSLSWTCSFVINYFTNYPLVLVTPEVLENAKSLDPQTSVWNESSDKYFSLLLQYLRNEIAFVDEDFVVDTIVQFIRKRELAYFLNKSNELIETGNWEQLFLDISKRTSEIITNFNELQSPFRLELFNELISPPRISTDFYIIDGPLGGLYNKELMLFLGDTNVGKSMLLCWLGANIVRNGGRVLHVTLEMSQARTFSRYFISLLENTEDFSSTDLRDLMNIQEEKLILLSEIMERERNKYDDSLRIVAFPSGSCETSDITKLLYKYLPDVLIIDYLDLLKSPNKVTDSALIRFNQSELLTELRAFSSIFNIPVITATQANRKASGKRIITNDMVAEDYGKIRIADNVISLGQNLDDQLRNEIVFYIMKARNTTKGMAYRYKLDFNKVKFEFLSQETLV